MRDDAIRAISVWYDDQCDETDAADGRWIVSEDQVAPGGGADTTDTLSAHHTQGEAEAEGQRIAEERGLRYIAPEQVGTPLS